MSALPLFESVREYFTRDFIVFFLLDAGIYLILVWKEHKRDWLFYGIALSLFLIPNFHIGSSEDFCLRASIPGIFILLVYCALLIGAATPVVEVYRGVYHVVREKTIRLAQDPFGSIEVLEKADNFTASDYRETFFFRYLARENAAGTEISD